MLDCLPDAKSVIPGRHRPVARVRYCACEERQVALPLKARLHIHLRAPTEVPSQEVLIIGHDGDAIAAGILQQSVHPSTVTDCHQWRLERDRHDRELVVIPWTAFLYIVVITVTPEA